MASNPSLDSVALCSRDNVCLVISGILRGAQRQWTDASLSAASGVSARNIKSYRVEGVEPPLPAALSLAVVLGTPAINAVLGAIEYVARPLDEPDALSPAQIVADGLSAFSVIASAAADGRFDHTEKPACQAAADQIIATVLPLSSAGGAQ